MTTMEDKVREVQAQMETLKVDINQKFELLLTKVSEKPQILDSPVRPQIEDSPRNLSFPPKIEFPKFDGKDPNEWIRKCGKYFELCRISENQMVDLASLYMTGKAAIGVASYLALKPKVGWLQFSIVVRARFLDETLDKAVENFNRLTQTGTLEEYIDAFECCRALLDMHSYELSSKFILDSFISGLRDNIKPFVKAFSPQSISQAITYARLQEETLTSLQVKSFTTKPFIPNQTKSFRPQPYQTISLPLLQNKPPLLPTSNEAKNILKSITQPNNNYRFVPARVKAEKMAKGLCYYCDKPFDKGHKCGFKEPQLFTVEVVDLDDDELADLFEENVSTETENHVACISVQALIGSQTYQTMRVVGVVNKRSIHIWIDTGSTHNFLDLEYAKALGCDLEPISQQTVTVADGNKISCQYMCKNFTWTMHGRLFMNDVLLIQIGSCDMVLGI